MIALIVMFSFFFGSYSDPGCSPIMIGDGSKVLVFSTAVANTQEAEKQCSVLGGRLSTANISTSVIAKFLSIFEKGCWKDKRNRAIPTLEGQDPILGGKYQNRLDAWFKCATASHRRGFTVFALQNGGWCASSSHANKTYKKNGPSTSCLKHGKGGPWANQVYELDINQVVTYIRVRPRGMALSRTNKWTKVNVTDDQKTHYACEVKFLPSYGSFKCQENVHASFKLDANFEQLLRKSKYSWRVISDWNGSRRTSTINASFLTISMLQQDTKYVFKVTAVAEGCSPFNVSTYFDVKTGCDRQRHFTQAYVNNSSQACSISFEGTGESANVTFYATAASSLTNTSYTYVFTENMATTSDSRFLEFLLPLDGFASEETVTFAVETSVCKCRSESKILDGTCTSPLRSTTNTNFLDGTKKGGKGTTSNSKTTDTWTVVGSLLGAVVAVAIITAVSFKLYSRKKQKDKEKQKGKEISLQMKSENVEISNGGSTIYSVIDANPQATDKPNRVSEDPVYITAMDISHEEIKELSVEVGWNESESGCVDNILYAGAENTCSAAKGIVNQEQKENVLYESTGNQ